MPKIGLKNLSIQSPKKKKTLKIEDIIVGEKIIDVFLQVIDLETRHLNTKFGERQVFVVVTTDGEHFIQITGWSTVVPLMNRIFTDETIGKTFFCTGLECCVKTDYNYGSVQKELLWKEGSNAEIAQIENEIDSGGRTAFFSHLLNKIAVPENFHPILLEKTKDGELLESDFMLQIIRISTPRIIEGKNQKVIDVFLQDKSGNQAVLTGWNIFASFMSDILSGNEGSYIYLRSKYRVDQSRKIVNFLFNFTTLMTIQKQNLQKEIPSKLADLCGLSGIVKLNLRTKILRKPSLFERKTQMDGTIMSDGTFKSQFFYKNTSKLNLNDEIVIKKAEITWTDSGVLSLTVLHADDFELKQNKEIGTIDATDVDYPIPEQTS